MGSNSIATDYLVFAYTKWFSEEMIDSLFRFESSSIKLRVKDQGINNIQPNSAPNGFQKR